MNSQWFQKVLACGALILPSIVVADTPSSADFSSVPPFISSSTPPLVMFALSNDHETWKKAYTDYSDLDGDGVLDLSLIHI